MKKWFKLIVVFGEVIIIGRDIKTQPIPFEDAKQFYSSAEAKKAVEDWALKIAKKQGYKQKPYIGVFPISFSAMLAQNGVEVEYELEAVAAMAEKLLKIYEHTEFWDKTVGQKDLLKEKSVTASKVMLSLLESHSEEFSQLISKHQDHKREFLEVIASDLTEFFCNRYQQKSVAVA